tara:strand:+ start:690 stop:1202 length:513 start_codon:yes stop_codon:yes gene_type:complete
MLRGDSGDAPATKFEGASASDKKEQSIAFISGIIDTLIECVGLVDAQSAGQSQGFGFSDFDRDVQQPALPGSGGVDHDFGLVGRYLGSQESASSRAAVAGVEVLGLLNGIRTDLTNYSTTGDQVHLQQAVQKAESLGGAMAGDVGYGVDGSVTQLRSLLSELSSGSHSRS